MCNRALFLSVDRAMFLPAVFTAHTAIANAHAHDFDTFIAVPENSVEPAWIDWAQSEIGVVVKEVPLSGYVGITGTANPAIRPAAFYRYHFDLFLPLSYEKLIYLDADIKVVGDISRLFELDLGVSPFAASPDVALAAYDGTGENWISDYIAKIGWDTSVPYANSGVLVIDPARWRQQDISRRVMEQLGTLPDLRFLFDQSALNRTVHGEFQPISPVWNMITLVWFAVDHSDVVVPAILHYAGKKPWKAASWTATYGPGEVFAYHHFLRNSPFPAFITLRYEKPKWRTLSRAVGRFVHWKLTGRTPAAKVPRGLSSERYRAHIQSFPFADKAQGLVACDDGGVLRVAV